MNFLFSLNIHGYEIVTVFWNLFLILIPCVTVYVMTGWVGRKPWTKFSWPKRIGFVLLFLFWLFWFPNTAYQFMIPRHLTDYCASFDLYRVCDRGSWMVIFFFVYALIGLPAFYYALERMGRLLASVFSPKASHWFTILMLPLTTLGVMLGLFMRANSWDVLLSPLALVRQTLSYLQESDKLLFFGVFTAFLYILYYGTDAFIRLITRKP